MLKNSKIERKPLKHLLCCDIIMVLWVKRLPERSSL